MRFERYRELVLSNFYIIPNLATRSYVRERNHDCMIDIRTDMLNLKTSQVRVFVPPACLVSSPL
jgi:hypothetical protein